MLCLLAISYTANAQTDFRLGYVIKAEGDTLSGEIDYRGDQMMSQVCKFRSSPDSAAIEFYPWDIVGFRFIGSKYYVSKVVGSNNIFLEFLVKGKLNLYYLRDGDTRRYFMEKGDEPMQEIPYKEGIKYIDNTPYAFNTKTHINILSHYLEDTPELISSVKKMGKPDQNNLTKLAYDYHNIVCKDGKCIIYAKHKPTFSVDLEAQVGTLNIHHTESYVGKCYMMSGVLAHIWMPRENEKLFFRTGILYSRVKDADRYWSFYKIPLIVEYVYPKGIVRPVLGLGLNIYMPYEHSFACMAGLNVKLHKNVDFRFSYSADFIATGFFAFVPKSLFSTSITAGVAVRL